MQMPTDEETKAQVEEEKKAVDSAHKGITSQSSNVSSGGGVALSGKNKLSLGFYDLN